VERREVAGSIIARTRTQKLHNRSQPCLIPVPYKWKGERGRVGGLTIIERLMALDVEGLSIFELFDLASLNSSIAYFRFQKLLTCMKNESKSSGEMWRSYPH